MCIRDSLGRRRDLYNVAQHVVDGLVHLLDFLKPVAEAQRFDLRLQVGVLSAGNLIAVDVGDRIFKAVVEVCIAQTDICPVVGELLQLLQDVYKRQAVTGRRFR